MRTAFRSIIVRNCLQITAASLWQFLLYSRAFAWSNCSSYFPTIPNEQKLEKRKAEYQVILERLDGLEQQGVIGAFDKQTIIDLSGDVIKEIAQKYENVQKGVADMMRGALIETEATTLSSGRQQR